MALENANYSFLQFFFSRLWRTLARKLMKRPAVFTTYFQSTIQIVHVYHVLRSEFFYQKFVGRFHFYVHFFRFPPLLRENLWKDLSILWLIFKLLIFMCTLTKFCGLKFFFKNMAALSKNVNNIIHFCNFEQHLRQNLWKDLRIFWIFSNCGFIFMFTKFLISKFKNKKYRLFQYVDKTLFIIPATLNNIFHKNYEKPYNFCNVFLKFLSICTLSRSFIMTTFLQQKWRPFQCC